MTRRLCAAAVVALAGCSDLPMERAAKEPAPVVSAGLHAVAGEYVVVLREGADAHGVASARGVAPRHVYMGVLNGFAARLTEGQLAALRRDPAVAYVEEDQRVWAAQAAAASGTAQVVVGMTPWGLDRIDQRLQPLDNMYRVNTGAAGVYAYIIDTGILASHTQFGGRAANVYDVFGGSGSDCNGHGTGVAGVVGSTGYGVAKQVQLRGVRVLDCNGSGTISGVIAGLDWVRANRVNPAVATFALTTGSSLSLNSAAENLAHSGVFLAVAAGNENRDACTVSPAGVPVLTTVAASTITDARASYSNYGPCVDLYAPGSNIPTVTPAGTGTMTGTSMAAAHVAGVGALVKATYGNLSTPSVDAWVRDSATVGVITGNPPGTPNRLLYKGRL